jgi:F0F1-type ATP synthase assembly protein I
LDGRFDTSPILLLLGAVVGLGAFVLRLLRLGRQLQNLDKEPKP